MIAPGVTSDTHWFTYYALVFLLSHWGRDKMAAISQTTLSNAFSWIGMFEFWLKCHWSLSLGVQLTIFKYCFRWWLGADQATTDYLNQWWLDNRRIYASLGLIVLRYGLQVRSWHLNAWLGKCINLMLKPFHICRPYVTLTERLGQQICAWEPILTFRRVELWPVASAHWLT